jgi:hypothetical protein
VAAARLQLFVCDHGFANVVTEERFWGMLAQKLLLQAANNNCCGVSVPRMEWCGALLPIAV